MRWLAAAAAIGLFALLGVAASTESLSDFQDRGSRLEPSDIQPDELQPGDQLEPGQIPGDGNPGELEWHGDDLDSLEPPDGADRGDGLDEFDSSPPAATASGGTPVDVEIRSPDGEVTLELGEDGVTVHTDERSYSLEPGSSAEPLLLSGDGRLVPVEPDDIRPGDIVLEPRGNDDGAIGVVSPDGTIFEISRTPGSDLAVTRIAPDGSIQQLTPDANGEIDVGGGVTIATPPPAPSLWERATSTPWRWIFLGILALAVASASLAYYLHRRRPDEPFGPDFVASGGVPADRFEEFVTMLLADDDPARAIRLAFLAAERGLGQVPVRRSTETPFEWSARVSTVKPVVAEPLSRLCSLFAAARFAPTQPTGADRDEAVSHLRQLHLARDHGDHGRGSEPSTTSDTVGSGQR